MDHNQMRIAQVSTLMEATPPLGYGGIERVVDYLCTSLSNKGHKVTLFASGDSNSTVNLVPCRSKSFRSDSAANRHDTAAYINMFSIIKRMQTDFDVIHFHTDLLHIPLLEKLFIPSLTTLHTQYTKNDARELLSHCNNHDFVGISKEHLNSMPETNWLGYVHNGLPKELYRVGKDSGNYVVFLGRLSPDKGAHVAISAALSANIDIYVAARIDANNLIYFDTVVKPLFRHERVHFIGEIDDKNKGYLLGQASALLFPVEWPEPFGMVIIEAMACGTPVIAFNRGAVPEIVEHGVTGFIVDDASTMSLSINKARYLSRNNIRRKFEERFTSEIMAEKYISIYNALISDQYRYQES